MLGVASLVAVLPVTEPAAPASRPVSWSAFLRVASEPLLLTVSFMGIVVHFATFSGVFGFIPIRAAQIGASSVDLGFITMLALGSGAFAALASSHLAERWGYSWTVRLGAVLLGVALLAVPSVKRVLLLEAVQVVNGAGRGLLNTTLMALGIRSVPPEERATAMGVYQAIYAVGMLSGPLISGFLANAFGLSSVFYLSALLCLVPAGMSYLSSLRGI